MTKKERIRTFGVFFGGTPTELDSNLRQAVIEQQWENYEATNDLECLAQICEHADYFGHQQIGRELAAILRDHNRRLKGYETELHWQEACRLFDLLSKEPAWANANLDSRRLKIAQDLKIPEEEREKWVERFRKQQAARKKAK